MTTAMLASVMVSGGWWAWFVVGFVLGCLVMVEIMGGRSR